MKVRPPRNGVILDKKTNILLVDGNSLFKRSFLGAKGVYNQNQEHIGGLYQFITVLRKLIDNDLYHKVIVFWDGKFSGKLRYNIYPEYKANRNKDYENGTEPIDESEQMQKFQIKRYLEELFIRQYEDEIVESDDLIAYICNNKRDNEEITICTSDRDLCQLIDDGVRIYMLDLRVYINKDNYRSFFNHHLSNAALIKTFCGDNSDNIKGIKRLGEETLLKLFPEIIERAVSVNEVIEKAKLLQEERANSKQKPLQVLDNIINCITDGVQGNKLFEINDMLVNLRKPLITESVIDEVKMILDLPIDPEDRGIKNAYQMMKEDGMDREIYYNISEYLLPFKRLIEREKKVTI